MSSIPQKKEKPFYGWVIVAASAIIIATFFGSRFSFGVFFKSIQGEFDLTRAATSSVFSVYMILCAVSAIVGGWAFDRYGPRAVVLLMGLMTGASLLITSQTNSLWQIYPSYSLLLAAGTGAGIPVLISTVSKWFDKRRGFAIGIAASGPGVGTLVVPLLSAYLISNLGWRMSYIVLGLIALLIVIPLSRLLRRDPKEMGILPDGVKPGGIEAETAESESVSELTGLTFKQALRTRNYWLIMFIFAFMAFSIGLILTHIVPHATDIGIPIVESSTILSVVSGSQILFRILVGRISDKIGRKIPGIICAIIATAALIWLIDADKLWMFYVFAFFFGLSWGGHGTVYLTLASELFGARSLGMILGALELGVAAGSATGPAIGGLIFDITGSYVMAFSIGAAAMLLVILLTAFIKK